jgi:XTP/dITP diphosphohydrolase
MSVLFATNNRGKLAEVRAMLADLPVEVLGWATVLPGVPAVVEDGETFEDNALRKARGGADAAVMLTLADDSGLEVDALGGRPGVRSARFAHDHATDAENNARLLAALEDVDEAERTARFRCVLVLVDPWSDAPPIVTAGVCEGRIGRSASGTGGFGYDPLFVVDGLGGRTMADLSEDEKNRVSHRSRALAAMRPHLRARIEERLATAAQALEVGA